MRKKKKLIDEKRDPIFTVIVDYGLTGFPYTIEK